MYETPSVEFKRDDAGVPVLTFDRLAPPQVQRVRDVMLVNGRDRIHNLRSEARAHLSFWDPMSGHAQIHIYGDSKVSSFLNHLGEELGMDVPEME